ncbi:hypothetical protein CYMTET_32704 [Cymbomonas tetramitiformis]|uniref:Uncharacterized protein n=1 Tax=Cymbomonas tetramitiformis TaxID=36881 RepID=A0AAE0KRM9_9CHLO|nr:hypothetical protein CYMTET_32704 [Cymbomonas tetramitiformis]
MKERVLSNGESTLAGAVDVEEIFHDADVVDAEDVFYDSEEGASDSDYEVELETIMESERELAVEAVATVDEEELSEVVMRDARCILTHPDFEYIRSQSRDPQSVDIDFPRLTNLLDEHCPHMMAFVDGVVAVGDPRGRNKEEGGYDKTARRRTATLGMLVMLSSISQRGFPLLRMVFTIVTFTASRGNRLVLSLLSSKLFRLCYSYGHLYSVFGELAARLQVEVPAKLRAQRKLLALICDNWQCYLNPKYERSSAPAIMKIGVQRGAWNDRQGE